MEKTELGRTGLMVTRTAFGALPIQRVDLDTAKHILRAAYENGINFFDTARAYTDSEEKIGQALADVRQDIVIATKTHARNREELFKNLETSLGKLKTDYIDIYQLHNPGKLPDPEDPEGLYAAMLEARERGMIRFISLSNHRIALALEAVQSGLYDTVQFPLNSLSSDKDLELTESCREKNIGLIAMKALSGGLITNAASTFAFLRQYKNVVPIWGIQRMAELEDFLSLEKNPPDLDEEMWAVIKKDREELAGNFCRACGYCMPCPEGILISTAARMKMLLRRAVYQRFLTDEWKKEMEKIDNCAECGQCKEQCPYGLDTPNLLKIMQEDYMAFYEEHVGV